MDPWLHAQAEEDAKRRRVDASVFSQSWQGGCMAYGSNMAYGGSMPSFQAWAPQGMGQPGTTMSWLPQGGQPMMGSFGMPLQAAAPSVDMTSRIVDALQQHLPSSVVGMAQPPAPSLGIPQMPQFSPAPAVPLSAASHSSELSARLMDSLRTLMPSGISAGLGSSSASQELVRVVQENLVKQEHKELVKVKAELVDETPRVKAENREAAPGNAVKAEPREAGARHRVKSEVKAEVKAEHREAPPGTVPAPKRSLLEDDVESDDDGVPHRLPPNFGAIPEDIVEERARQREEARMLQMKATQPCRFSTRCKKRDCPNAHTEGRDIDQELNPCAFGRRCKRQGCFYDHPEGRNIDEDPTRGMCKWAARCSRTDCLYAHPEGRAIPGGADLKACYFCHDGGHIATDCPRNPESWNFSREAERRAGVLPALTN